MNCLRQDLIKQLSHKLFEYDNSLSPIFETNSVIAYDDCSISIWGFLYIEGTEEDYYDVNLTTYYEEDFGDITKVECVYDTGEVCGYYYFIHQTSELLTVQEYYEAFEIFNTNY